MSKTGKVKTEEGWVTVYKHDYGTSKNPFTPVKYGSETRYIAPDKYAQKPGESLEKYFTRLAKQADQRLVRIEQLSKEEGFQNVEKYAYARAMRDIKLALGEDANRFNQKRPTNKISLKARIKDIKHFLELQTSTKGGILKVFKKKADVINKKYGTNFTWQELANYFEAGLADKDADLPGTSGDRIKAYYKTKLDIQPEAVEKANKQHKIMSDNEAIEEVSRRLKEKGYDYATIGV